VEKDQDRCLRLKRKGSSIFSAVISAMACSIAALRGSGSVSLSATTSGTWRNGRRCVGPIERRKNVSAALSQIIRDLGVEASNRGSWFELERAKRKLADLGKHLDTIRALIEKPERYSTKKWEKVRTDLEWMARRLTLLIERMDELRPLTMIEDDMREEHTEHDF
jgi:hypothetical protein